MLPSNRSLRTTLVALAALSAPVAAEFQIIVTGQVAAVSAGAPAPVDTVAVGDAFVLTLEPNGGSPFPGSSFASYFVDSDAGQLEIGGAIYSFEDSTAKINASAISQGFVNGGSPLLTPSNPMSGLFATFEVNDPNFNVITTAQLPQLIGATVTPSDAMLEAVVADSTGDILTISVSEVRIVDEPCPAIGTSYCTATTNSATTDGRIVACGSEAVADDDVQLIARRLPASVMGFFAASRTQDLVPLAGGSEGNLCLGGVIGRLVGPAQMLDSGTAGRFSLDLDLTRIPEGPVEVAVMPGETWNFTAWYRDSSGGTPTSNFTDGVSVTFQ